MLQPLWQEEFSRFLGARIEEYLLIPDQSLHGDNQTTTNLIVS